MDYNSTFEKRGKDYCYAIQTYPNAMDEEFRNAVDICKLSKNDILLNIPSACIPIENYFTIPPKEYYKFETNEAFANLVGENVCSWTAIPLPDSSCSKILCLASLHHSTNEERELIYKEFLRLLSKEGSFIIGDVLKDSPQDKWLNEFVNQYNSNGHKGQFWSEHDLSFFHKLGLSVSMEQRTYPWKFSCKKDMVDFCKHLFGLDLATNDIIEKGLHYYLNATDTEFNWTLLYFTATRSQNTFLIEN
jgi:hypothetical protein